MGILELPPHAPTGGWPTTARPDGGPLQRPQEGGPLQADRLASRCHQNRIHHLLRFGHSVPSALFRVLMGAEETPVPPLQVPSAPLFSVLARGHLQLWGRSVGHQ